MDIVIENSVVSTWVSFLLSLFIIWIDRIEGSFFVLEKWLTPAPFAASGSDTSCDLDIARSLNAKAILEQHWDEWITENDWNWMVEHGINSIRLPVSV